MDDGSIVTPVSNVTSSSDGDTFPTDDSDQRRMVLIQEYSKASSSTSMNESTMKSLTRAICLVILPKVKFLPGGRGFGSFDQPDISNPNCWVNRVFDRMPHLKNASDRKKAEIWMTYRSKIKEQFSLHRSGVTLKMKKAFISGKYGFATVKNFESCTHTIS